MVIKVPAINFYFDQSLWNAVILFPVVERFFNFQRFCFFLFLQHCFPSLIQAFRQPRPELLPALSGLR